jgi:hypothetical protein
LILILLFTHWKINLRLIFNACFLMKTFLNWNLTSEWSIH